MNLNTKKIINHISQSIVNAQLEKSKLNNYILELGGFSSRKIRHFLNNLMEMPNINYLEIGTFQGSTFSSALYKNNLSSAYAIDDWSEFQEYGKIKSLFLKNTKDYNYTFFEEDCFTLDLSKIKEKINVYLYDGEHRYRHQYEALKYYYPILNDEFIFMVDDFDPYNSIWAEVEQGTRDSIRDLNLKILYEQHLKSSGRNDVNSWWNGYFIALLKKQEE